MFLPTCYYWVRHSGYSNKMQVRAKARNPPIFGSLLPSSSVTCAQVCKSASHRLSGRYPAAGFRTESMTPLSNPHIRWWLAAACLFRATGSATHASSSKGVVCLLSRPKAAVAKRLASSRPPTGSPRAAVWGSFWASFGTDWPPACHCHGREFAGSILIIHHTDQ